MKPEIPNEAAKWVADLADSKRRPLGEWTRLVDIFVAGREVVQTFGAANIHHECTVGGRKVGIGMGEGVIPLNDDGRQQLEVIRKELEAASGQTFPSVEEVAREIQQAPLISVAGAESVKRDGFSDIVMNRIFRKLALKKEKEKKERESKGCKLAPNQQRHLANLRGLNGRWFKGIFYRNGKPQKAKNDRSGK